MADNNSALALAILGLSKSGGGGGGTSDFDALTNRPKYNGSTITSETNIPEVKTAAWDAKQDALTAGTGIAITNGVISCTFANGDEVSY